MANKWIIIEDRFIMGNVEFHADLADEDVGFIHGGGLYNIDAGIKRVNIYGSSFEFGSCTMGNFSTTTHWLGIPSEVTGYDLYFVSPESVEYFIKKI